MQKFRKSVLIGSSGTGNAFSSILSLRRNWGSSVKIVGMDINHQNLVTSSLLSDKYYQVSPICNPEFENSVIEICSREEIDTYIPFIDSEILKAAMLYEQGLLNENLGIQVKSTQIADMCNDKYKTFLRLTEMNIPTPDCYISEAGLSNADEYIVKPRNGYGSQIQTLEEIRVQPSLFDSETYIIQHRCEPPEITIDVCSDDNTEYFTYVCRERIETKSGVCTKARLFYDNNLETLAVTIAKGMKLNAFCFQVMKYKDVWAVTDINARLGAGTAMSYAAGLDFFSGMFAILWGEDPSEYFRPLKKETYITRQYCDFLMEM
jgi:carbamoylphosphate synthase large subunit